VKVKQIRPYLSSKIGLKIFINIIYKTSLGLEYPHSRSLGLLVGLWDILHDNNFFTVSAQTINCIKALFSDMNNTKL